MTHIWSLIKFLTAGNYFCGIWKFPIIMAYEELSCIPYIKFWLFYLFLLCIAFICWANIKIFKWIPELYVAHSSFCRESGLKYCSRSFLKLAVAKVNLKVEFFALILFPYRLELISILLGYRNGSHHWVMTPSMMGQKKNENFPINQKSIYLFIEMRQLDNGLGALSHQKGL